MRNYEIDFNGVILKLIPSYLRGRKFTLFLKSLAQPLKSLSSWFKKSADWLRIQNNVTSQKISIEGYLNLKYSPYFADQTKKIVVENVNVCKEISKLLPLYYEKDQLGDIFLYDESDDRNKFIYKSSDINKSYFVYAPKPDPTKITENDYMNALKMEVETYNLATKTYKIILE